MMVLRAIQDDFENKRLITNFSEDTILANYDGHTIFTIFYNISEVYKQLQIYIEDKQYEDEDVLGRLSENNFLRRLYRILNLPTMCLLPRMKDWVV